MRKINNEVFRQYDIRGIVGDELTDEFVGLLGKAIGTYILRKGFDQAVVGRDNRESSPAIRQQLVAGLVSTGCNVVDIGEVITPIFYYARVLYDMPGGAMITGSHNPSNYNGFKISGDKGPGTIYGDEIQKLRQLIEADDFESGSGTVVEKNPVKDYLDMLAEKIKLGPQQLKVVVDCGNGTASDFAPEFLRRLGCEVECLYCESDPTFPNHHPDPVKTANLQDLIKKVAEVGADVGVSFDGDADRIGAVDEKGTIIWGDTLMILYWREIMKKHPGADAIIEVKCSQALVDEVEKLGGRPVFYKTGHSLIKAKMKELKAVFTGEMSGHMFFADEFYGFDDALYATGRLLRILSNDKRSLSEMLADVAEYHATPETRIDCPDSRKFDIVEQVAADFKQDYKVIDIDGARVLFPGGWGLIRCSNTQPVIVARCEGKTPADLEFISGVVKEKLMQFAEIGDFQWGD
ncbi:phosphomannomutase/phosphoglucomutase [Metallumcola ferriviriculae]|uniref:Phosphomannomutase/phosphoglucomutase n=1 Tax=Metallumcola ferriviriculae TaxID=3039180 RepID=A0AAU0UPA6_9FIRM|nr:phosphomannomutase/phosphoglucomutase [Desulfitibacteraceae bacterium MK1]